jgi:hypothetical protein
MSDSSKFYKLASVVDDFLAENDLPNGWWNKMLLFAIRGLRELHIDTPIHDAVTILLPVTDRNTVVLPADYVDWCIVSKPGNKIVTLGVNGAINPLRDNVNHSTRDDIGFYLANYKNGAIFSYGIGVSAQGAFRTDDKGTCKELILDIPSGCPDQIYLEYITDGFNPCGETTIHPYIYDYLIMYLEYQYEDKNNPKATESSKWRKSQDVFFAEKKVRGRFFGLSPQTFLNLVRENTTLAVKV